MIFTEGGHPTPRAWLDERCRCFDVPPERVGEHSEAVGLVVRSYTTVNSDLLNRLPNLKVVGRGGVGLESIDVAACRRRGVEVVYTPDANTRAVAEFVHGLMLRLVRPWHLMPAPLPDANGFLQRRKDAGEHLADLTLGVLGMGRVGRATARIAHHGFGMKVLYHDLADVAAEVDVPATAVDLPTLLGGCDVLSVHVDGRPGNRDLLTADRLRGGFRWLINTSRGLIARPEAIADALRTGPLQGVALDVYDPEPPEPTGGYDTLAAEFPDRVLLTPHMASRTKRAVQNMSWVVRDVWRVIAGEPPEHSAPT